MVVISFFNLKLSIALFISSLILIPYWEINFGGITIDHNILNIVFIFSFFFYKKRNKSSLDFELIHPFIFLYISLLFLTFFTQSLPWLFQYTYWFGTLLKATVVSFIIWNVSKDDPKILLYVKWSLILSITLAGIYGVFLMKLGGFNPYTSFVSLYFGKKDAAFVYSLVTQSRFSFSNAGKIQSTMSHPMTWTLMLCFLFVVFFIYNKKEKKKYYWFILGLLGFNILISGVRTGIASLTLAFAYFFLRNIRIKIVVTGIMFLSMFYLIVSSNKDLSNIFISFVDVEGNQTNVGGSSLRMRLNQLDGVFNELQDQELFVGKGFGWTSYYQSNYGDHPTIKAFESLIFVILCNSGLIGAVIWMMFFVKLFKKAREKLIFQNDIYLIDIIIITYISYSIGTGEYSYIQYFSILYTFLISSLVKNQNAANNEYQYIREKQITQ